MTKDPNYRTSAQHARGLKFVTAVDSQVLTPEKRIIPGGMSNEELFAQAVGLLIALTDAAKRNRDDDALKVTSAMTAHLEGATWNTVARELNERIRTSQEQRDFLARVAFMAAAVHEGRPYSWRDYPVASNDSIQPAPIPQKYECSKEAHEAVPAPATLEDTIVRLVERKQATNGQAVGLLLLFQLRDTSELDPASVRHVTTLTQHMLQDKVREAKDSYPLIQKIVGDRRDAIEPIPIDKLMTQYTDRRQLPDVVQNNILRNLSKELEQLFDPFSNRAYRSIG